MKVYLSSKAKKSLDGASADLRVRLESKLSELQVTPYPSGCKKLMGAPDSYRLRVGGYRILYTLVSEDEVLVFKIAPRGSAYEP